MKTICMDTSDFIWSETPFQFTSDRTALVSLAFIAASTSLRNCSAEVGGGAEKELRMVAKTRNETATSCFIRFPPALGAALEGIKSEPFRLSITIRPGIYHWAQFHHRHHHPRNCSAGVLACGFGRRPAARTKPRLWFSQRDAAETRRRDGCATAVVSCRAHYHLPSTGFWFVRLGGSR
jgi:hypothetical protein